ncbi:MAG TPA: putative selenate ABC transporter substrate-binding protein [Bacillota bacterium]
MKHAKACRYVKRAFIAAVVLGLLGIAAACGGAMPQGSSQGAEPQAGAAGEQPADAQPVFAISGIPDQDVSILSRRFGLVAEYLEQATGLNVQYVPAADYAAVVTGFERGDIHLAWFGGLTAVQAIAAVPGSEAVAQRPRDAEFHSVFIVQADLPVDELPDLKGLTFTFGSESSTSGHLMPRYFLLQAGIDPERDFATVEYSGSHDTTIKLVEAGTYQSGALNEAVWEDRLEAGQVDTEKVRAFYRTPAYYDYNWTIRAGVDEVFGPGTKERVVEALLAIGPEQKELLELFQTDRFMPTRNENYEAIRTVAEQLGIIR